MSAYPNSSQAGPEVMAMAFGSRLQAATDTLLRAREQVLSVIDRQVLELQQIHRALSYVPPAPAAAPVAEQLAAPVFAAQPAAPLPPPSLPVPQQPAGVQPPPLPKASAVPMTSLFEQPPHQPQVLPPPIPRSQPTHMPLPSPQMPAPPSRLATSALSPLTRPLAVAPASPSRIESALNHSSLDPSLERATLEELNDALASAFAVVSQR